ncbi:hypothetical protein D9V96_016615 [Zobellia laminariae]|uniref:hypothetical protein n=1 Tax=Zobellia laminariae TaxID=248906 RepID=UPI0012D9A163|nr:hypothetical protein [Zobellia laminariae]
MNFRTENIEISGETYSVNIPSGEVYLEENYNNTQAAKTIYTNLYSELKEKLSLEKIELILTYQGNYIENQQRTNQDFTVLDKANIQFLEKRIPSIGRNLSKDEILEIFHIESFYLKLINVID